eukprot:COSAG02_NODE_2997_length_7580_cov_8.348750_2_plen_75_part_00
MDDSFCSDMENDMESSFEVRQRERERERERETECVCVRERGPGRRLQPASSALASLGPRAHCRAMPQLAGGGSA